MKSTFLKFCCCCKLCEEVIVLLLSCWTKELVHPAHLPPQLFLVFNSLQFWYVLLLTHFNRSWDSCTWSLLKCLSCCISIFSRGPQTSQKSRSHFHILGARMLTCSKFHTKHLQFWSDPWLTHSFIHSFIHVHVIYSRHHKGPWDTEQVKSVYIQLG